jgi:tetratricopeptide (TPR) repeat protein
VSFASRLSLPLLLALSALVPARAARAQDPLASLEDDDVATERRAELARVLAQARTYLAEGAGDPTRLVLADRACENAARLDARSGEVELVWARVTIAHGDVAGALRHAERAATLAPRSLDAQLLHASLLLDIRDARRAKAAYERALALRATSYEARLGLALALRRGGDATAAAEHLRRCTRDAPTRPEAFFELGVTLGSSTIAAEISEARASYARFLALAGDDPRYADAVRAARAAQTPRAAPVRWAPRSVTRRH